MNAIASQIHHGVASWLETIGGFSRPWAGESPVGTTPIAGGVKWPMPRQNCAGLGNANCAISDYTAASSTVVCVESRCDAIASLGQMR
jgi:hypothetical protein